MDLAWGSECVGAIEEVLNELNPTLIFTHWAFDTHQDHHHGAMSTLSAARYFGNILMYDPLFPSGRSYHPFRPQVYIDITETIERKMDALRCHLSEHRKYGDGWLEAVRARARFRGYETGVAYAEAFEVVRLRLAI
jgi:LmbE family N-acetylglucosaminyl deacetylase